MIKRIINMSSSIRKEALVKLHNGIKNDASVRRYSLGWSDIVKAIEKQYKRIEYMPIEFTDKLLVDAINVAQGKLKISLEAFAKELQINVETLNEKYKQVNKLVG